MRHCLGCGTTHDPLRPCPKPAAQVKREKKIARARGAPPEPPKDARGLIMPDAAADANAKAAAKWIRRREYMRGYMKKRRAAKTKTTQKKAGESDE